MENNVQKQTQSWTDAQLSAITTKNKTLLLSAAAGSGKTTTLTERIIRSLIEDKADISRMLIVTFTRASANDLRAKIFIARNGPFYPSVRCLSIIHTFHTGKVQPLAELILPGLIGMGRIGHGSPNTYQIAGLVFLGQWLDFTKMRICIFP